MNRVLKPSVRARATMVEGPSGPSPLKGRHLRSQPALEALIHQPLHRNPRAQLERNRSFRFLKPTTEQPQAVRWNVDESRGARGLGDRG